ncbi:hypothetical protein TIFTF001_044904 [Ficus carica]|uniref:Uncharacterized protein n=1 Tax=Ficus carica TaxID=3494 RepID=A0AA88A5D7_FICCA|nr:hypothetical protein TIFTF001_044904 [Ficus carica]
MFLVVGTWSAYWAADSFRRSIPSCHVSLVYRAFVPRGTPPRAGRQSGTLNFEISKFELKWESTGSPIAASKTAPGFYARPSPINSEGQSAFFTPAYEN